MGGLCSTENTAGFNRLLIESDGHGGFYAFAFERAESAFPEWDYLLDDIDDAKAFCLETWGAPLESWRTTDETLRKAKPHQEGSA